MGAGIRAHFVAIPVFGGSDAEEALNEFLATHAVLSMERQLISDGARSAWAVCVTWRAGVTRDDAPEPDASKRPKVDYREVLSPEAFKVFVKLRELRKTLSERDNVPAYALFTNEQLAEMVRRQVRTVTELGAIEGVGPARIERYAREFLAVLGAPAAETSLGAR